MGSFAPLVTNLSKLTDRIIDQMGTDAVFVLRAAKSGNGRGGTSKDFQPTTAEAWSCFYSLVPDRTGAGEAMRAEARRPVVHYRFVVKAGCDVTPADKLQLVPRAPVGQKTFEIVRVADAIGLTREVIAVEEVPL